MMYHLRWFADCPDIAGSQDPDSSHGNHGGPKICTESVGRGWQRVHPATGTGIVGDFLVDSKHSLASLKIPEVARVKCKLWILIQGHVGGIARNIWTQRLKLGQVGHVQTRVGFASSLEIVQAIYEEQALWDADCMWTCPLQERNVNPGFNQLFR